MAAAGFISKSKRRGGDGSQSLSTTPVRRGLLITLAVFYWLEASHRPTHTPGAGITWGVTTSRESSLISWKPTQRVGVEMGEQLLPTAPVQVRMAAAWSRVEVVRSGQIRPLFEDAESDLWAVRLRGVLV